MYVVKKEGLVLNAHAAKVVEICKAGGYVTHGLEKAFKGGEKFAVRVYDKDGALVKGLGYRAVHDALALDYLKELPYFRNSAFRKKYGYKEAA